MGGDAGCRLSFLVPRIDVVADVLRAALSFGDLNRLW